MDSMAKRKASSAILGDNDGRSGKRQKVSAESNAATESIKSTTAQGLKFVESLRSAKDKTGRPIADHFLTLPGKNDLPDYYEYIKLPIAIDTIENKLVTGKYESLAQVESDCKRLVNNAKSYNDKRSLIYEDAERLRKTASNWMVKHNPAYRDGNYVAVATPVPGEEMATPGKPVARVVSTPRPTQTPVVHSTTTERARRSNANAPLVEPTPAKSRPPASKASASAAGNKDSKNSADDSASFVGKTFQQAQEQIVGDIIEYEDGGLQIFTPFVNLPNRALKDYYQLIKEPMSLSAVLKRVKGVVGREQPTGHTLFKSWDTFENCVSLIWKNARIYNEDGSEISNLSKELEDIFYSRLNDAKIHVDEPPQPKLKLNISNVGSVPKQQLKLRLKQSPSSDRNTPGARNSVTPSITVDNESLQRQQRHVLEGMTGGRVVAAGKTGTFSGLANSSSGPKVSPTASTSLSGVQTKTAGSPPTMNGLRQDVQPSASNATRLVGTPQGQGSSISTSTSLLAPALPHAIAQPTGGNGHSNGILQHTNLSLSGQTPGSYLSQHTPYMESFRKVPIKSLDEALIPKIKLNSHPALNFAKPWSVEIRAHKQKCAHSATIVVSPFHSYLQITPRVPIALTDRLYRLFVTVNGNRTLEVNRIPLTAGVNGTSPGPGCEGGKKKGEPVFEAKLVGGVNRIEVEIVAEKECKIPSESKEAKDHIEMEKCTIFLHLLRQSMY